MPPHRSSIAAALLAGSALLSSPALPAEQNGGHDHAPAASAAVQVTDVQRRTLEEKVVAYGHLQPDPQRLAQISLPRAGRVDRLFVRPGQRVRRGDRLLQLDTAPAGSAGYSQARTALEFAKRDLARLKEMLKEHLATREQVAKARQALADARAQFEAQRRLGANRATQTLTAPFDAIVTALSVTEGERVQADSSLLTLASNDALIVTLGLEPEDAVRTGPGTPVTLTPVFPPAVQIHSQISAVHGMINPKTRLVDAIVSLPGPPPPSLVLDEYLRGTLTLRAEQTLAVPRSAVLRDNGGAYLFVVHGGEAHRVEVATGLESGDWIAVSGQLKAGDPVVSLGNYELSDGMAVRETGP